MLIKYFPDVMDVEFTAKMEQSLDDIEDGGKVWQSVIADFYEGFEDKLVEAMGDGYSLKEPDEDTDIDCTQCGTKMVLKNGRFGKFLACPAYPKCKHTMQIDADGNVQQKQAPKISDQLCAKCGAPMLERTGRFGKFLGCSAYPACKNIVNIVDDAADATMPPCPQCQKPLRKVVSKRGAFYGCSDYPKCKYTSNQLPSG
jgi:DNA topoisomerase-1